MDSMWISVVSIPLINTEVLTENLNRQFRVGKSYPLVAKLSDEVLLEMTTSFAGTLCSRTQQLNPDGQFCLSCN